MKLSVNLVRTTVRSHLKEAEIRQLYELEIDALLNEINALKNKDGQDSSFGKKKQQKS